MKYYAILIDGDIENTLGRACSRDVWNIIKKLKQDIDIENNNIFTFFHDINNDIYVKKIKEMNITNIQNSNIQNIKKIFDDVVNISFQEECIIFFHYSGHGYQVPDDNGDEIDGMDEIFLGHSMRDDYIWDNLISKLNNNTIIIAFMDACHSGSGVDMPYLWKNKWILAKKNNIHAKCKGYSFSACNDSQCASQDIGETTGFAGSLTAGICDVCNINDIIYKPIQEYDKLKYRMSKLKQNVELYSVKC